MIKLRMLLIIILTINITGLTLAQKAKFKSEVCIVQKAKLPIHATDPGHRGYDIMVQGVYGGTILPHEKRLFGWKQESGKPDLKALVSLYGFQVSPAKKSSESKEKKDKEGKVIERWTEYSYQGSAVGKGTLHIYGPDHPFVYESPRKKKSKYDQKQEAKEEAEKKDLADNPFLTAQNIEQAEESNIGDDVGLEGENLKLVNTINIDQSLSVSTSRHRSLTKALEEYNNSQRPKLQSFSTNYPNAAYRDAIKNLNDLYGFAPVNYKIPLRQIKNEDHPEFKMWNDACQAAATIFKTFRFNKSIDQSQQQLFPVIQYFADQVDKISENDKKAAKQKKAAFQNLVYILYYLDLHDEVIVWSEKFVESKQLDYFAKTMLEKSDRQKAHLQFHQLSFSHINSEDTVDESEIEMEETADAADDDDDETGN